jgi:hypothetical protein
VELEAEVDGGRIDVLLTGNAMRVGIEVSVTNTVEYELKNIQKCIDAKCNIVILICTNASKIEEIRNLLPKEEKTNVELMTPDQLANWFIDNPIESKAEEQRIRGYSVKVKYKK